MTIKRHLSNIKSNIPNKIPSKEDIRYGEIAINYSDGNEKIYLKNEKDIIQSIQTDLQNDEKFATKQSLSGETKARLDAVMSLNDTISANQKDTSAKFDYVSSVTDSLQSSAETLTNNLNNYLPLTGGTVHGQVSIESDIAPLNVNNTILNEKLNADLLDGIHANGLFTNLSNEPSTSSISLTIGNTNKTLHVSESTHAKNSDTASTAIKTQGTLTLSGGANGTFNGNNDTTVIIPSNNISLGTTGNVTTSISSENSGITYNKGKLQVVETSTSSGYAKSYKLILDDLQLGETIDIPKNEFLSSVSYDESTKILTFHIILQDGQLQPTNVNLSDLIDVYDSNNGIQKTSGDTGSTFSIKVKNIGNEFLGVDANGVYVTGVTTAINNAVATEANTRETNDNALNNTITAETASRISAYNSLHDTITSETANRTTADTTLNNAITAETANRTTAINNAVATEANTRETNDNALNNAITAETANRISADSTLNNAITAETKSRTDNDAYLSGVCTGISSSLSTESTNRTNGDTALNNAITAETANRISADSTLHQEIQGITSVTHSVNSDYSTNSGSATKLATARNIWGQSFDGSGNVDGILSIEYGAYLHTYSMFGNKGGTILYNNGTLGNLIFSETGNGNYTFGSGTPGYLPSHNTLVLDVNNNRVGIGTVPENFTLDVDGDTHINGSITALAFYESSDRTLKENISLINEEDSKKSENVSLKEFNFKEDEDKVKHYGVIAQEVQEAGLDNLVKEDKDGKLSVDYISLLILKISQLENKVKELENKIN